MADLTRAIHVAIYAALTSDSPPAIAGERIYDLGAVPLAPTFPYVEIGDYLATPNDDKGTESDDGFGDDFAQMIHIWTRDSRGKKAVEEIMAAIYAVLHDKPLPLGDSPPAGTMPILFCRMKQIMLDQDGLTLHGIMRFEGTAQTAT